MTKKDYVLIAEEFRTFRERVSISSDESVLVVVDSYAEAMAARLAAQNPRFNRRRFLDACGVQ